MPKIDIWRAATPDAGPRDELATRDDYHGQVTHGAGLSRPSASSPIKQRPVHCINDRKFRSAVGLIKSDPMPASWLLFLITDFIRTTPASGSSLRGYVGALRGRNGSQGGPGYHSWCMPRAARAPRRTEPSRLWRQAPAEECKNRRGCHPTKRGQRHE